MTDVVLFDVADLAATVTINRPEALDFTDIGLVKVQPTGLPGPRLDATVEECEAEARLAARAF